MKGQSTFESYTLANGNINEVFYTDKQDKTITALANYYKRKVKTERLIVITTGKSNPIAKYITKVTILQ
jgi:predicted nucleic-acid-binding protein